MTVAAWFSFKWSDSWRFLAAKLLSPPSDSSTREWMARNNVDGNDMAERASWAFRATAVPCFFLALAALALASPLEGLAAVMAGICAPIVISSHIANEPSRMAKREARAYLRHAPAVIGTMAMSMSLTPSLERAVLLASAVNRDPLGRRLARVSWDVLTRSQADVESSLASFAAALDQANQSLRQSLHLLAASSHEPTRDGMERLMEKAHEVSVQGLRRAVERYVSGLSAPVMAIFALGILLPIMLLSILPLFALAGPLPSGAEVAPVTPQMPLAPMAFLLLAVVPMASLIYARSLLESSPMSSIPTPRPCLSRSRLLPWLVWVSLTAGLFCMLPPTENPILALLAVALPLCLLLLRRGRGRRRPRADPTGDFIVGLYQVGNRLSTGASLEKALAEAAEVSSATEFSKWARGALHLASVSRIPLEGAMEREELAERLPLIAEAFHTVARCSQGDGVAAGGVAVRLAKSLGDIMECEQGIEERLKGVVDMMRSTSLVFAPIVLGVTIGLFGLTSSFTGGDELVGAVTMMAGMYVIELAFVVSYLTTFLSGGRTWEEMLHHFATRMPMALLVFISASLVSHTGFARWW